MAQVENVELIEEFTDYLGQYFRYMTRNFDQEVTLKEELDHALVYLAIQEIRFGSKFQSEIDNLDRDCHGIQVPRVLLQPLVENVFEHGLKQKSSDGLLVIRYVKEQHALTIIVEDNGESLDDDQLYQLQQQLSNLELTKGETTGLLNVAHRLRIKFGFPYGVQVERSLLGGLCVKMNIPRKEDLIDAPNDDN
ncbi:Sensor histidine kinase YehU [compost metagenome]